MCKKGVIEYVSVQRGKDTSGYGGLAGEEWWGRTEMEDETERQHRHYAPARLPWRPASFPYGRGLLAAVLWSCDAFDVACVG